MISAPSPPVPRALPNPKRGEVWWMELDPARGAEMQKTRPVVVLSPAGVGRDRLRLAVPVIGWKPHFQTAAWMIEIAPDAANGLSKTSGADASQIRAVDVERFVNRIGILAPDDLETVTVAAALCLGYEPPSSYDT